MVIMLGLTMVMAGTQTDSVARRASQHHENPHIIFLMVDDLGWNQVGWNNPKAKSPNMDRLAKAEGAVLTRFYTFRSCGPSCVPSATRYTTTPI
jgi:hypothetical protein